ncbi:hypothetical protein ACP_1884 [Acidobacterium capsulatum ATCC 51196]|uniref:Uncharacterized protein n=1 Tax=Acidobacterium capsulatum (strain ATCC 51196 / DSM 11244 / BCRC 80197 / JCM 7670 / NBRC 15755 / NCIMB 13165 / 161) TaxID=240015 RepID=C1F878_ACIC5|nr:hypothetical protein ACP_1884 [Acidobacterium capsulatum ATCC 51196]
MEVILQAGAAACQSRCRDRDSAPCRSSFPALCQSPYWVPCQSRPVCRGLCRKTFQKTCPVLFEDPCQSSCRLRASGIPVCDHQRTCVPLSDCHMAVAHAHRPPRAARTACDPQRACGPGGGCHRAFARARLRLHGARKAYDPQTRAEVHQTTCGPAGRCLRGAGASLPGLRARGLRKACASQRASRRASCQRNGGRLLRDCGSWDAGDLRPAGRLLRAAGSPGVPVRCPRGCGGCRRRHRLPPAACGTADGILQRADRSDRAVQKAFSLRYKVCARDDCRQRRHHLCGDDPRAGRNQNLPACGHPGQSLRGLDRPAGIPRGSGSQRRIPRVPAIRPLAAHHKAEGGDLRAGTRLHGLGVPGGYREACTCGCDRCLVLAPRRTQFPRASPCPLPLPVPRSLAAALPETPAALRRRGKAYSVPKPPSLAGAWSAVHAAPRAPWSGKPAATERWRLHPRWRQSPSADSRQERARARCPARSWSLWPTP